MVRRRKDPRWALIVAGVTAVSAIGYYVYSKYRQNPSTSTKHTKSGVTPDTKVAIVVNKSLVQSGVPLGDLLDRYRNMVLILTPEVSDHANPDAFEQLDDQVASEAKYRMIPCETDVGVSHVLKHLRSALVVLPGQESKIKDQIASFVGTVMIMNERDQFDLFNDN